MESAVKPGAQPRCLTVQGAWDRAAPGPPHRGYHHWANQSL